MDRISSRARRRSLTLVALAALFTGCADEAPLGPDHEPAAAARSVAPASSQEAVVLATLRRVTARYHDLNTALADGFILLHECEVRPGEGAVGTVYFHPGRTMDGVLDPESPDALVYEPTRNGRYRLVAVEMVMPYALWGEPNPPQFLGNDLQPEDEFQVFGLHVWVWRHNPEGMFAEANPRVSCEAD
jgi:hypothetical protein